MEEEIKKRGRGRPRKGEESTKAKATKKKRVRRKKETRGGKREGAGRKKGVGITYSGGEMLSAHLSIRVREITNTRVKQLRELTKQDDMPFNRMFESWVADLAQEYGLE